MVKATFPTKQANTRIAIVGEAPGALEETEGRPFVGASGQELTRCLATAGIEREACLLTNVFEERPPGNNLREWTLGERDFKQYLKEWPDPISRDRAAGMPRIGPSMRLKPDFIGALDRLYEELNKYAPTMIIALGNTALWALCEATGINKHRGTVTTSTMYPAKVIPTYHPAAVLREWGLRPILIADLIKAKKESEFPEIRTRHRELWLDPTLEDLWNFYDKYIDPCSLLSVDIETARFEHITCIGYAPSPDLALVIPHVDRRKPGYHYWSEKEEIEAWNFHRHVLSRKDMPYKILGQNFTYDFQYLHLHGVPVRNYLADTMLHHHALFPELPKSLGFMGSIYSNEISWKSMRQKKANKREE